MRVVAPFLASRAGMGQQVAEQGLLQALQARSDVDVRPLAVSSMRSDLSHVRRLPLRLLATGPYGIARAGADWAYRGADLIHRMDLRLPPGRREVVTVHDVAPLRFPDEGAIPAHAPRSLRAAAAVVCPSRFAADDVANAYGLAHVHVVSNGLDPVFEHPVPLTPAQREGLGFQDRWILHTGGASLRKNLAGLAAAWSLIQSRHQDVALVLAGPVDARRDALFGPLPRTHLVGHVPRSTLVGLMAGASAVVVPSTYEGFGLPVLEAMACGVPVVVSATGSLPEVAGAFGHVADPTGEGLADAMERALEVSSPHLLAEARAYALGHTWAGAAAAYGQIYRGCR